MSDPVPFNVSAKPSPLAEGVAAARANLLPGLVLWAMAFTLVVTYYRYAEVRGMLAGIAELKTRYGYVYSAFSTALFGGLIPFLYMRFNPHTRSSNPWHFLIFYLLLWAYKGMEVDLLYRLQAFLFGNGPAFSVVAPKVLVDQMIYCPFWVSPTTLILFAWRDSGFSVSRTRAALSKRIFLNGVVRLQISTWMIWLPAVSIIYTFPAALQVLLFNQQRLIPLCLRHKP